MLEWRWIIFKHLKIQESNQISSRTLFMALFILLFNLDFTLAPMVGLPLKIYVVFIYVIPFISIVWIMVWLSYGWVLKNKFLFTIHGRMFDVLQGEMIFLLSWWQSGDVLICLCGCGKRWEIFVIHIYVCIIIPHACSCDDT